MDGSLMHDVVTGSLAGLICNALTLIIIYFTLKHSLLQRTEAALKEFIAGLFSNSVIQDTHEGFPGMKEDILIHFDDFMQNRLTEEMPVLKMFVDEQLTSELKQVFNKELDRILPLVLGDFMSQASQNKSEKNTGAFDISAQLKKTITASLQKNILKQSLMLLLTGIITGAAVGWLIYII